MRSRYVWLRVFYWAVYNLPLGQQLEGLLHRLYILADKQLIFYTECTMLAFQAEPLPPDNNSWLIQNLRFILK